MTFKDLRSAKDSDATVVTSDTAVVAQAQAQLDTANSALTASTSDASASYLAYAVALFGAPGNTVVYAADTPITIDQSLDGKTVTTLTFASGDDPVPAS